MYAQTKACIIMNKLVPNIYIYAYRSLNRRLQKRSLLCWRWILFSHFILMILEFRKMKNTNHSVFLSEKKKQRERGREPMNRQMIKQTSWKAHAHCCIYFKHLYGEHSKIALYSKWNQNKRNKSRANKRKRQRVWVEKRQKIEREKASKSERENANVKNNKNKQK